MRSTVSFSTSFRQQLNKITRTLNVRVDECEIELLEEILTSVKDGHPRTGAPGQPIKFGTLYDSMTIRGKSIYSKIEPFNYGPFIEEGIGAYGKKLTLRSAVGGFHSLKTTKLNFRWLARDVALRVKARHPFNLKNSQEL